VSELTTINRALLDRKSREERKANKSQGEPEQESRPKVQMHLRFWQIQNLNFIALLACRLITLDCQNDPNKLLQNSKVKQS
jgi:hypothetical protein